MKKLLSVLASIGLVATASTSVVSCTKTDQTPYYSSISDIKDWSFTNDNEVIPNLESMVTLAGDSSYSKSAPEANPGLASLILGTIGNKFKNPKDFVTKTQGTYNVMVDIKNPVQVSDDKGLSWNIYNAQLWSKATASLASDPKQKVPEFTSEIFQIKSVTNPSFKVLSDIKSQLTSPQQPLSFDATSGNILLSTIKNEAISMSGNLNSIGSIANIDSQGADMMQMDSWMFNQLANTLSKSFVPGLDKDGVRYSSLNQQIAMSYDLDKTITDQSKNGLKAYRDVLVKFNKSILDSLGKQIGDQTWQGTKEDIQSLFKQSIYILNTTVEFFSVGEN